MSSVIFSTLSSDNETIEFEVQRYVIPVNSMLHCLIRNKDNLQVAYEIRDGKEIYFISDTTSEVFSVIVTFLTEGVMNCSDNDIPIVIKTLDILGCLAFDFNCYFDCKDVPPAFMKVLQEESWYRTRFNMPGFERLHTDGSLLVVLTDSIYKDFELVCTDHLRYITSINSDYIHRRRRGYTTHECADDYEFGRPYVSSGRRARLLYFPDKINTSIAVRIYISCGDSSLPFDRISATCDVSASLEVQSLLKKVEKYQSLRRERNDLYGDNLIETDVCYTRTQNCRDKRSDMKIIKRSIRSMFPDDFDFSNILVAGGSIVAYLKGISTVWSRPAEPINDIDLFFYGMSPEECERKLAYVIETLHYDRHKYIDRDIRGYKRTKNSVTMNYDGTKIQVILKCYKTREEILMGFDVDCCSVGFDGDNIYMTPRALHAFKTGMNIVNLSLASPTYDHRLAKYMQRGFAVYVPQLNKNYIDTSIYSDTEKMYKSIIGDVKERLKVVSLMKRHRGLDYILMMSRIRMYKVFGYLSDYEPNVTLSTEERSEHSESDSETSHDGEYEQEQEWIIERQLRTKSIDSICYSIPETRIIQFKIPDSIYQKYKFAIPQDIEWMIQDPSKQVTNTFNKSFISNPSSWYFSGKKSYYKDPKDSICFLEGGELSNLFDE